ncbi:TPA: glycosyltransferase family 2 protein, partial [Campylobacter jejuni]|nr:glycosyltransferase family 2 protein [Campylobacter jejuni]
MNVSFVSVIIPIYNVEKYLDECLKSVINQTYKNLDIILVDDGSTDNSLNIAKEYAKKDERIFLIIKENGGLSSARNAGLEFIKDTKLREFFENEDNIVSYKSTNAFKNNTKELVKEEINKNFTKLSKNTIQTKLKNLNDFIIQDLPDNIIHFLDSDDCLELDCIEKCVNEMSKDDIDICTHNIKEFLEEGQVFRQKAECDIYLNCKYAKNISGIDFFKKNDICEFYFAWQGAFRASLLNVYKLRFTYGIYHEDHDFGTILFLSAKKITCIKEELLIYRIRANSIIKSEKEKIIPKNMPFYLESLRDYFDDYSKLRAYFKAYCMCKIGVNILLFCKESRILNEKLANKIFLHYIHYYIEQYYPLNYLNIKALFSSVGINLRFFRFRLLF